MPQKYLGDLFEQFVGLELIRLARLQGSKITLHYWRDPSGPEVDWLLSFKDSLLPIEVKWTEMPSPKDAKHLELFLREYPNATQGYAVCRVACPQMLSKGIEAISWKDLISKIQGWYDRQP